MSTAAPEQIKTREQIEKAFTWDLDRIYPKDADFEKEFEAVVQLAKKLAGKKGTLSSAAAIAAFFLEQDEMTRMMGRLATFSRQRSDEDTGNTTNQARKDRTMARLTELGATLAWWRPELLSHPIEKLRDWTADPALAPFKRTMSELLREKPHTLSEAEETLLSSAGEIFSAPYETFGLLNNADFKFPNAVDANGTPHEVSPGRYISLLVKKDRVLRKNAFDAVYDTYGAFGNTLSKLLATNVKVDNLNAKLRHFGSALEASLHPDNIPVAVYDSLISATHEALPEFHRYLEVRRESLGLDALNMWDMAVPIVPEYELQVPYHQAVDWVKAAMAPMGEEYLKAVDECFAQRWVDVYENRGKRSGAYSGGCYDSPPYILLNYQGTLDDVFTLAHELGHSIHTWMSNKYQPYRYSDYTIFVAEIASTTAEALLQEYLTKQATDPRMKAYLLNHYCDSFKSTVYRQTMFAEFERMIHEADQQGQPLTADWLNETYYALNAKYFGPSVTADKKVAREWSRIPHFYYNFYVYKYATGLCASQLFSRQILSSAAGRDQYLEMLKSGGSDDPLALVRKGGVDLADKATLVKAFGLFGGAVTELGKTLKTL